MYDNDSVYLYEIWDGFQGFKSKKEAELEVNQKVLWYNFTPHDKKDPILLTLMNKPKV